MQHHLWRGIMIMNEKRKRIGIIVCVLAVIFMVIIFA